MKKIFLRLRICRCVVDRPTRPHSGEAHDIADPAKEARARDLSRELRCMVCQNQSIDDSEAPLARDLRLLVRERIAAGDSNSQVIDFLVARYGEFVLLKPRFNPHTLVLWLLPPLALAGGGLALWTYSRRRSGAGRRRPVQIDRRGRSPAGAADRGDKSPDKPARFAADCKRASFRYDLLPVIQSTAWGYPNMAFSLYDASVANYLQTLGGVAGFLDRSP